MFYAAGYYAVTVHESARVLAHSSPDLIEELSLMENSLGCIPLAFCLEIGGGKGHTIYSLMITF